MKKFILEITIITFIALLAAIFLGFPLPSGIHSADLTQIELIRNRYPIHFINPEFISPEDGDIIFSWCVAEAKARIIFIFSIWIISIIVLTMKFRRGGQI